MSQPENKIQVLVLTPGSWWLRHTGKAFENRAALAALWISDKNNTNLAVEKFQRCWPYHLAMKPFYQFAPQIWIEHAHYFNFPFWRAWFNRQPWPAANVVQAIIG